MVGGHRELPGLVDAIRGHNALHALGHVHRPTGEEVFHHAALDVAEVICGGYAPMILFHGEGEWGTGTGISKSTAAVRMAVEVQEVVSAKMELELPDWIEENHTLPDYTMPDPRDWKQVAYGTDDITRFREYARDHRGRPYILVFDEGSLGMLGTESQTEAGRYLFKEMQGCRNDDVTLFIAMAWWKKLADYIVEGLPYSCALPKRGGFNWCKRAVHRLGFDPYRKREAMNHFPVELCLIRDDKGRLKHPGGPWDHGTFRPLPPEIYREYEEQKNRRRDFVLHHDRVKLQGRDMKALHEGESQDTMEKKILRAIHLLDWNESGSPCERYRSVQGCELCSLIDQDRQTLPPKKRKAKEGERPNYREISRVLHTSLSVVSNAAERRAKARRGGSSSAGVAAEPATEQRQEV